MCVINASVLAWMLISIAKKKTMLPIGRSSTHKQICCNMAQRVVGSAQQFLCIFCRKPHYLNLGSLTPNNMNTIKRRLRNQLAATVDTDPAILVGAEVGEGVAGVGAGRRCTRHPSGLLLVCPGTTRSRRQQPSDRAGARI